MAGDIVLLAHGSGGTLGHELLEDIFIKHLGSPVSGVLEDAALVCLDKGRPAFTTDSYVVQPIFFPGGVNDLAMRGARPLYLSAGFILEEGLSLADLERIVVSMAETAQAAGVRIVTGDTKVVERGGADKLFINTAGIGLVPQNVHITAAGARPGDAILVSGALGDHGLAIMTQREGLRFLAASSDVGIEIDEAAVPIHAPVRAASELLGLDPLYVANEGKLVAFVKESDAERLLEAMRAHPLSREAALIGRVVEEHRRRVILRTVLGTHRLLDMLAGEQLPRIC